MQLTRNQAMTDDHSPKKRYIIHAPPLSKSTGVRMLYTLYEFIRNRGFEAFIYCTGEHRGYFQFITDAELDKHTRLNDIVVYPESVPGNPLRFRRVVRYVLYYPGKMGGDKSYHPKEVVFTWTPMYYKTHQLFFPCVDITLFRDEKLPKTQDCYFVHKGGKWKDIPEVEGLLEINMSWPTSREELARILKTTGTLYSYDAASLINTEASLCGAKVKIVTQNGFEPYVHNLERYTPAIISALMDNFLTITQNIE
ncbi:hypothetical protein LJC09_04810 [Desulfovibrio sp. OttesenSCG-928-F20]|nr:hypothetical protein [Desulfovibrio sp. OttesenSCG-928-M16]MDL2291404.1 hypothetical protein [Desulfovibrio sp. OttesenSCG-928-F20]